MKYKVWHIERKEWISDMWNIYMDPEGEVYEIEESAWAYERFMSKERITDRVKVVYNTGLKDKDGTESYHKDIIEFEELKYVVEWDEKNTGYYLAYWRDLDNPESDEHKIGSCIREGKILGNVFENSDLLSK